MKQRKVLLLFYVVITTLIFTACSNSASDDGVEMDEEELKNVNDEGMPIVKDKISLDFFAGQRPTTNEDWNDVLLFNEYAEMTNIDINWEMVPSEGLAEKRNLALGGDQLPDVFHSANIPLKDLVKYGEQGLLLPLNDLIDEYAPNFQKVLEEYPDIRKAITMPDGNIYSFPSLTDPDFLSMNIGSMPWYRADWLEELDMDIPETTDEFYEFLKAIKENDLIGDGQDDEIPFGAISVHELTNWFEIPFGIGNRGRSSGNLDLDPDEDKVRFYPITDNYREMLEYVHQLFEEGLIEQDIFSQEDEKFYAKGSEGRYASTFYLDPAVLFSGEHKDDYISGLPLEGPHGDDTFSPLLSPVVDPGAFVITSENDHPAATVRWIDHFYGDEGIKMFLMGFEGETYEETENGEYQYVEDIRDNPDGLILDQAVARYLTWPGGGYPSLNKEDYFKGSEASEAAKKSAEKLEPYLTDEVWPAFSYTEEENKKIASFGSDIEKYAGEMKEKFINGDKSLEDDWDDYVETLYEMNLDEYMDIQQKAYERYKEN